MPLVVAEHSLSWIYTWMYTFYTVRQRSCVCCVVSVCVWGGFSLINFPLSGPESPTKINMAAVILSATVFGDQYLKHPVIPLAFIWRIHRHTTGMSHKHVEAFFKDRGGGGTGGGRRKRRGQWCLLGSILHIIVIWSFPTRKKEEGCESSFFLSFFHTLARLCCG